MLYQSIFFHFSVVLRARFFVLFIRIAEMEGSHEPAENQDGSGSEVEETEVQPVLNQGKKRKKSFSLLASSFFLVIIMLPVHLLQFSFVEHFEKG
ncbi:MAG: hypothetical protein GY820_03310, partial [Gammaproteobacteria bacterium]|nr:hypothetical protein [Gammaproteobacteria bacterium]